ncbi:MAG: ATP synthase F1 subunit delta [Oscillospiraceae bacterium]
MTQQTVGKVYAEALFMLAQEEHKEKQVFQELNQFYAVVERQPEFISLMSLPTLSAEERIDILRQIIGDEQGITENFLCLLVEKHRFNRLSEIRNAFNAFFYEAFNIAEVFVTSATPLTDAQKTALKERLQKKLGKNILLHESVDSSLIGGMIVQYGDTRMDNSLRTRIKTFQQG